MGMTDKQFASYQAGLLRELKKIKEELAKKGTASKDLDAIIKDLENELMRP